MLGFGQVRHTRLKPARNAFAYPTYFLMLPMRAMQKDGSGALAHNRRGMLSFFDRDHGDGRDNAVSWLDELLLREGVEDATGEIWLHTYPRVLRLHLQARELLVLPHHRRPAARHRGRGQQHLWRTALLSAGRAALWRRAHGRQGVSCLAVLHMSKAATASDSCAAHTTALSRAPWCALTTTTPPVRCCKPA